MEIKGMSIDEFKAIVDFVQKHHYFAKWLTDEEIEIEKVNYPKLSEYGYDIKYVDSCYDTRTGDVWSVTFRGIGNDIRFATNSFIGKEVQLPYNSLHEWILAYLKGEWNDEKLLKMLKL